MTTSWKSLLRVKNVPKRTRFFSTVPNLVAKNEYVVKSPFGDVTVPNSRFVDRLFINGDMFKNRVALISAETKKTYTYQHLKDNMARFATSIHKKLGLSQGDVVTTMLPNSPEFPVVAFGTLQAGCILSTINPIYKEYEICHQVSMTAPKLIITTPEYYTTVINGLKMAKSNARVIVIDTPGANIPSGVAKYTDLAENTEIDARLLDNIVVRDEDIAIIPFSSGTTGLSKGVDITHKNLLSAFEVMSYEKICFPRTNRDPEFQDILPCFLPFFHIYGLAVVLMGHLAFGCKLITMSQFSASLYFDILLKEKPSLLYMVPPVAILLGKHPDINKDHFRNVRHVICGAAPVAATDVQAVIEKADRNLSFHQGFGSTETTSLTSSTPVDENDVDYSSCGQLQPSISAKFIDPLTGNTVPLGEPGEICIKGPIVMKGYHNNQKETLNSMTGDGFFKTGDLGYYKPSHGLYITDRIKELIKVKGMQVAPAELESILRTHPDVADAGVIGIPHEYFGEVPKAYVVIKRDKKVSSQELQEFVAAKVAAFKRIESVDFVDSLPKTATGKILRRELKKM